MYKRMSELAHCYILQHPLIVIYYLPELIVPLLHYTLRSVNNIIRSRNY